jgi:futalosine hydrolase
VGKANAALALGPVLERARPQVVLAVGVAGAYPGSGLAVGEAAVATEEIYGDEGVETPRGFRGMEETTLPLWEDVRTRYFNRFPTDPGVSAALAGCGAGAARLKSGPFVTLSTVTGTRKRALELERRHAALCETMEGAAFAHAAAAYGAAFGQVRGVSNPAGPRNRASWKIHEAAAAAQEVALRFLRSWPARSA